MKIKRFKEFDKVTEAMLRQDTVDQMNMIQKEIDAAGDQLDLTSAADKNIANGLWIHDPYAENRSGKRKIATIDQHMKILKTESSSYIKEPVKSFKKLEYQKRTN